MNRKLLVAVVSGALALPLAASVQADATVYGSLRFGVAMSDTDEPGANSQWDLGSNRSSRLGVKGSMEAGEGLTAGFHFERAVNETFSKRHHNVYLSGAFGTLKFGQQDAPYYGASTWDGSQTLGGLTDFVFRSSGVSYASSLGGPFNFSVLLGAAAGGEEGTSDGVNHVEGAASLATGPVNLSVAYFDDDDGQTRIGGTAGGNAGPISWKVGADSGQDSCGSDCNDDRYGFHVGYGVGNGNAYVQFSESDSDMDADDTDGWVFGYSHVLAQGVVVYGEFSTTDAGASGSQVTTTKSVAAVKVTF